MGKWLINGVEFDFNLASGALGWCSDWADVQSFVNSGHLRAEHGGPATYGSINYFLTDKGRAEGLSLRPVG